MAELRWQHVSDLRIWRQARLADLRRIIHLIVHLTILFCLTEPAHAQYGFEVWTVDSGMPENEIRGITQTPDGYLWIATFNGLARFDGVHLTVFNRETPGLLSNQFGTMLQGKAGDLWLNSVDRGIVRYHDGVFRADGMQGRVASDIKGLTGDDHGDVWALAGGRIIRWDEASDHFVDIAPESPNLLFRNLLWDSAGFWSREHEQVR